MGCHNIVAVQLVLSEPDQAGLTNETRDNIAFPTLTRTAGCRAGKL